MNNQFERKFEVNTEGEAQVIPLETPIVSRNKKAKVITLDETKRKFIVDSEGKTSVETEK